MNLTAIKDRIVDQMEATLGTRVDGAAELQVAIDNPEKITKPHAFVVWTADVQLDQSPVPGQQARFREDFTVVIAVDNSVDKRGEGAVADIQTIGALLKTALVGWAPSTSHLPIVYTGSGHSDMDTLVLLHSFAFAATIPGGSVFSYNIELTVELLPAVTITDLFAAYATAVDGVIGSSTRLASDYLLDREVIPESATRYQLVQVETGEVEGSNNEFAHVRVRLSVHHHFAPGATERSYTESTMATALGSLLPPSFWRNASYVNDIIESPSLGLGADLARE